MLSYSDRNYLRYFPFLSNSGQVTKDLKITIENIENSTLYNSILVDIYKEIHILLTYYINDHKPEYESYQVAKFYITIFLLKGLDNIAVTRIWVKFFMNKIESYFKQLLEDCKTQDDIINLFLDIFWLLESDGKFKLKRITVGDSQFFGMRMLTYLDLTDTLIDDTTVLHKGYVIIPFTSTDFLIKLVQQFATKKIYSLYEKSNFDFSITTKLKTTIDLLKKDIMESTTMSINIKKHYMHKEILHEQQRIKEVELSNIILKDIEENNKLDTKLFPPCIVVILDKLLKKKIQLSHNENLLLVSYLNKKNFPLEHIIKIFSKAKNYNPSVTKYQVEFACKKNMMPSACSNLLTEGLCFANDICKKYKIKNPLVYRSE